VPSAPAPAVPVLRVQSLSRRYTRGGLWRNRAAVAAVNGVDFEIFPGKTLALVGESGSGKSTVARCVARVEKPDSGQIWFEGEIVALRKSARPSSEPRGALLVLRNRVQMVFQDPVTSMNPRFTAAQVVEEPLRIMGLNQERRRQAAATMVEEVGLSSDWLDRSVLEFSGGQRQRLAIARALIARPKLLVLDEALTGLDLSTQAQIANLLLDLQAAHSLTYLLISHDLALVAHMADTVAVMAGGRIVEMGSTAEVLNAARHEETVRLLSCARATQSSLAALSGASA